MQHPPVYTVGKRGVEEHFKVSRDEVRALDTAARAAATTVPSPASS